MTALCSLMKPPPAKHGADALRLIGKLGGLNRMFLLQQPFLPFDRHTGNDALAEVVWNTPAELIDTGTDHFDSVSSLASTALTTPPASKADADAVRRLQEFMKSRNSSAADGSDHTTATPQTTSAPRDVIPTPYSSLPMDCILQTCFSLLVRYYSDHDMHGLNVAAEIAAMLQLNSNAPCASIVNTESADSDSTTTQSKPHAVVCEHCFLLLNRM